MADRYRGAMYVGVTSHLAARIYQHKTGEGSDHCAHYGLCIEHEKRLKRWRREWKFALIERANPDWRDLYPTLI